MIPYHGAEEPYHGMDINSYQRTGLIRSFSLLNDDGNLKFLISLVATEPRFLPCKSEIEIDRIVPAHADGNVNVDIEETNCGL